MNTWTRGASLHALRPLSRMIWASAVCVRGCLKEPPGSPEAWACLTCEATSGWLDWLYPGSTDTKPAGTASVSADRVVRQGAPGRMAGRRWSTHFLRHGPGTLAELVKGRREALAVCPTTDPRPSTLGGRGFAVGRSRSSTRTVRCRSTGIYPTGSGWCCGWSAIHVHAVHVPCYGAVVPGVFTPALGYVIRPRRPRRPRQPRPPSAAGRPAGIRAPRRARRGSRNAPPWRGRS
jgi:hypothetical protein